MISARCSPDEVTGPDRVQSLCKSNAIISSLFETEVGRSIQAPDRL